MSSTTFDNCSPPVKFAYKQDGGDFAHAALRCVGVGVGKCRVPDTDGAIHHEPEIIPGRTAAAPPRRQSPVPRLGSSQLRRALR